MLRTRKACCKLEKRTARHPAITSQASTWCTLCTWDKRSMWVSRYCLFSSASAEMKTHCTWFCGYAKDEHAALCFSVDISPQWNTWMKWFLKALDIVQAKQRFEICLNSLKVLSIRVQIKASLLCLIRVQSWRYLPFPCTYFANFCRRRKTTVSTQVSHHLDKQLCD